MIKIHSIETFGTHEGPGIRFVLFLQGCLFKCLYCHNPDTISNSGGKEYSDEKLLAKIHEMKPYFAGKGGVTVSGGEPLLQAKDLLPFFKKLKAEHINIAVDTNGFVWNDDVKNLIEYVDLFLIDIKHMDPNRHQKITGQSNQNTLTFIDHLQELGKKIWIRYVYVPGYTDQPEYVEALGKKFGSYSCIERLELLPYHKLGAYKRKELGWKYELEGVNSPSMEIVDGVKKLLEKYFKKVVVR